MKLPISCADIILPVNADMTKWATVACDQFTSSPLYWETLENQVANEPSTLKLIFPECYLSNDNSERISEIERTMKEYISRNLFRTVNGMILTQRDTAYGKHRRGIVALFNLDDYSFVPSDNSLIRATEGTILERIPPRVEIRSHCELEFPHIMLLADDEGDSVFSAVEKGECLYDFELNMRGGHAKGNLIKNPEQVLKAFELLLQKSREKYGEDLLFAVGDGNHSLATAKACWEKEKQKEHPNPLAQFALAEVVNIYDEGIYFEPIHRIVKGIDETKFLEVLRKETAEYTLPATVVACGERHKIFLPGNAVEAVAKVQSVIDGYIAEFGGQVDYIHGEKELENLAQQKGCVGIKLKSIDKGELFPYIVKNGVLPRKTFSMGEAEEKRYYIEGRRIK